MKALSGSQGTTDHVVVFSACEACVVWVVVSVGVGTGEHVPGKHFLHSPISDALA